MKTLADIGVRIRVTPGDEIWIWDGVTTTYVEDRLPFYMRSNAKLEDGHIFYGVCGPILEGPARYQGLIGSIFHSSRQR